MVLFGDSEQYMLTTNSDILSSETVNVTKVANYTFDPNSNPIYLGANVGFVSKGLTRFYEMTNLYDRGPVDINERSQQIQTQFGQGFNSLVSSREQSQVLFYKRFVNSGSKEIYMYRFRQENSQESSQTSWVKWEVDRPVCFMSMPQDKIFAFVARGGPTDGCDLYKMDSSVLEGLPASTSLVPPVPKYTDGYTITVDSVTNEEVYTKGADINTIIEFPTIYAQSKSGPVVSDVTANLTIHRVKLSTALVGSYNLTIDRAGYDSYELTVEQTPADNTIISSPPDLTTPAGDITVNVPPIRGEHVETVPVYTRNTNLTLTMSTTADAPLTLQSMTWEGDWNRPYYRNV